jgi:hypothetical protein
MFDRGGTAFFLRQPLNAACFPKTCFWDIKNVHFVDARAFIFNWLSHFRITELPGEMLPVCSEFIRSFSRGKYLNTWPLCMGIF